MQIQQKYGHLTINFPQPEFTEAPILLTLNQHQGNNNIVKKRD